ncbi:MAG: hypothetical protein HY060_03805 [Proteobacteria bacterium]|nr:hypothetical protein [Pseudomonadota bacterium]
MHAHRLLWLAALIPWAAPASAEIIIQQAEVAVGDLIVAGQVVPPAPTVTLGLGAQSIILQPDAFGRFAWIGNEIPPSCAITVINGPERARAGVAACGLNPPAALAATQYGASGYSWRRDAPAPGIGGVSQTTTATETSSQTTSQTTTVRRRLRPIVISPNDPRYALTEPPHAGQAEVEGARSAEMLYPQRGFYGPIHSRETGG